MSAREVLRGPLLVGLVLALATTLSHAEAAVDLSSMPNDGWYAWSVPALETGDGPCCHTNWGKGEGHRGCVLGDERTAVTWSDDGSAFASDGEEVVVYVRREGGETRQVHALATDCPVKVDGELTRFAGVSAAQSLDWLDAQMDGSKSKRIREGAIVAMAHHADSRATRLLDRRAAPDQPRALREQAVFWLALLRGEEGLTTVQRLALGDMDRHVRQHAVFSLSQSKVPAASRTLERLVKDDAQPEETRGEALFWLAQSGAKSARSMAEEVLRARPGSLMEEKAIFALSQLPDDRDAALIGVIEGDYARSAKKQALFWLGQSGSEDALRAIDRWLAAGQGD